MFKSWHQNVHDINGQKIKVFNNYINFKAYLTEMILIYPQSLLWTSMYGYMHYILYIWHISQYIIYFHFSLYPNLNLILIVLNLNLRNAYIFMYNHQVMPLPKCIYHSNSIEKLKHSVLLVPPKFINSRLVLYFPKR